MQMNLATFGLDKLSVQERLELIETLWDSLPDQLDTSMLPDWHLAELAKRREESRANPGQGKSWREIQFIRA